MPESEPARPAPEPAPPAPEPAPPAPEPAPPARSSPGCSSSPVDGFGFGDFLRRHRGDLSAELETLREREANERERADLATRLAEDANRRADAKEQIAARLAAELDAERARADTATAESAGAAEELVAARSGAAPRRTFRRNRGDA